MWKRDCKLGHEGCFDGDDGGKLVKTYVSAKRGKFWMSIVERE